MFDKKVVDLFIELDVLNPDDEIEYTYTPGERRAYVHLPGIALCFDPSAAGAPKSETVTGTWGSLSKQLATDWFCACSELERTFAVLGPDVTSQQGDVIEWLIQCVTRRELGERDWANYTVLSDPGPTRWAALDAAVASEVAVAEAKVRSLHESYEHVSARVAELYDGEDLIAGGYHNVDTDLAGVNVRVPRAPRTRAADVIAHHNQYRVWVTLSVMHLINAVRVFAHVDPFAGEHLFVPENDEEVGKIIAPLPFAVVVAAGIGRYVIGVDDGYAAEDVAETLGVFPTSVPLADQLAALAAARI